jgi:hypothetical protein
MFTIIWILVVSGPVAGGYLMEHGNLKVLLQPAELLVIGGAGLGTVLIAKIGGVFCGSKFTRQRYLDSLYPHNLYAPSLVEILNRRCIRPYTLSTQSHT